jgi:hypothetical protein
MTGMLPLAPPRQARGPRRVREHQVHTLPALQSALQDLVRFANDQCGAGPINLADFDPRYGVTVSLNDDGAGLLFVKFESRRPKGAASTPDNGAQREAS